MNQQQKPSPQRFSTFSSFNRERFLPLKSTVMNFPAWQVRTAAKFTTLSDENFPSHMPNERRYDLVEPRHSTKGPLAASTANGFSLKFFTAVSASAFQKVVFTLVTLLSFWSLCDFGSGLLFRSSNNLFRHKGVNLPTICVIDDFQVLQILVLRQYI